MTGASPAAFALQPAPTTFIVDVINAHPGKLDEAFRLIEGVVHCIAERKPGFLWGGLAKSPDGLTVVNIEAISDAGAVERFFSDPMFLEKFRRLDALLTSEFPYAVWDLVLPKVAR